LQQGGSGALTYREKYRDLQFWENSLLLSSTYRDLYFLLQGQYAALGSGSMNQRFGQLSFTQDDLFFQFGARGWAADGVAHIGYSVNLTPDRTYKLILIPLLGYSAHFERLIRSDPSPDPLSTSTFSLASTLPDPLKLTWYGFLLGIGVRVEPGGPLIIRMGYNYSWLHMRLSAAYTQTLLSPSLEETTVSFHTSTGGNLGQTGWLHLDYKFTPHFRLGLGSQIHYYTSEVLAVHPTETTNGISTQEEQKLKVRWTPISAFASITGQF
jgi:hypothetical protein